MGICCMAQEAQQGLCINLEGWNGVGDGREVQKRGGICIPMADSLEGLMLKLKLQYFVHLMGRVDPLEKTLMLEGIGGRRRRGPQGMR